MDFNMRELAGNLTHVRIEAGIAAFSFPRHVNLSRGVAEHRAEAVLDAHHIAEFFLNRVDADPRDVGPDAKDVRKMFDIDDAHDRGLCGKLGYRLGALVASGIDLGQANWRVRPSSGSSL